jgi:NTP pyrophosphatase (non-canonical NTP hydrolase)
VTTNQKIRYIANHYGYESQSRQCIEEMAELTQAINKLWRATQSKCKGVGKVDMISEAIQRVAEEIADVEIMIAQLQELLGIDDERVMGIVDMKLDREIMRIREARQTRI